MATPITVVIRNQQYRIVADEDEAYILACAEMVNKALEEALKGTTLSLADGAVLAAMNVADQYLKELEASENLRRQVKENLEEANALKLELSEAKREIFKLGTRK